MGPWCQLHGHRKCRSQNRPCGGGCADGEHLVRKFEGAIGHREWAQFGAAGLAALQVQEQELSQWTDALHPAFKGVVLG